jgi:hypothetical protein
MNRALSVFLLSASFASMLLVIGIQSCFAQAATPVSGVISRDTTWTIAGSPYVFVGAVGIAECATLTIDAGVTVEMGSYYLEVNGTLNAQGTPQQKIFFNSDSQSSGAQADWINTLPLTYSRQNILLVYGNPKCTLEHAVLNHTSIQGQSFISITTLALSDCTLEGSSINVWGTTTISDCYITDPVLLRGASTISGSILLDGLDVAGSCSGNSFTGTYRISGNNITSRQGETAVNAGASGEISDNVIWGARTGICHADGYQTMSATIENNLIVDNQIGIFTRTQNDDSIIKDNTITGNKVGISNPSSHQVITGNRLENNTQYSIQAGVSAVSAAGNWWGTTDAAAISQSIFDSNDDFSLGTIVYTPFLTSADASAPQTPDDLMLPTVTAAPTDSVTFQTVNNPAASLGGFEVGVAAAVAFVGVSVAVVVVGRRRRA